MDNKLRAEVSQNIKITKILAESNYQFRVHSQYIDSSKKGANGENWGAFPLLNKITVEILTIAIRQENEMKVIQKWKKEEIKVTLFVDDNIVYTEKSKNT